MTSSPDRDSIALRFAVAWVNGLLASGYKPAPDGDVVAHHGYRLADAFIAQRDAARAPLPAASDMDLRGVVVTQLQRMCERIGWEYIDVEQSDVDGFVDALKRALGGGK